MKDAVCDLTIVIPSYNPDEKLNMVVDGLREKGFYDIIIVNDGSDAKHLLPFEKAQKCTVIHHRTNKGKGRALKTAFQFCIENRQNKKGVITVDGDNQHSPDDVYACGKKLLESDSRLVLGCRDFKKKEVPARSRLGNLLTRTVFQVLCGVKVSDTQTGLRAIPMQYLPFMMQIPGERYEYETHMLLEMKNAGIPMEEVAIQTIYLEDNQSSHFRPILDSLKIYKVIGRFAMNSMLSTVIDLGLFYICYSLLHNIESMAYFAAIFATVFARICSSVCNYLVSRKFVFQSKGSNSLVKYYVLCLGQMAVSALLVNGCAMLVGRSSMLTTILKAITDTALFFVSFRIQRNWVFKRKNVANVTISPFSES